METAVCYIRVSTEEQARDGVSLQAQEERLTAYCRMAALEVASFVREEGTSASKPLSARPGGEELLKTVGRRDVGHVVALKLDRLFRNAEDALRQTSAWDKAGVALHLVDMGGLSLNTKGAMGRLLLTMMAAYAEFERNVIAERTESALQYKKAHREAYSPTPYGYDRVGTMLAPNSEEQAVVARITGLRQEGRSLRAIAQHLNVSRVPTKQGGTWHASTVRYVLANSLNHVEVG